MEIIRTSRLTGRINKMDLPITESELVDFGRGATVNEAFPLLTPAQRDFFMTGVTEEEIKQQREIL